MRPDQVVTALRMTAVDHNIRLMHRLGHEQLFANILESARSEQNAARLGAYLGIFEEYFTYWSASQKEQTLEFLYDLLLIPDGGVRRRAAALLGRVLAGFNSGYKKELPAGAEPDPADQRPFVLWKEYLARLIYPDRRLTPMEGVEYLPNHMSGRAFASGFDWDGEIEEISVVIPDTVKFSRSSRSCRVTKLGGFAGRGGPYQFGPMPVGLPVAVQHKIQRLR